MTEIHIDTDIGGDIDDLCALAMVLRWRGAKLVAVTTNSDDQGRRAGYARYVLDLAGAREVPVAAGADASEGHYRVWPGIPDEHRYWPEPIAPHPSPPGAALDLLENSIRRGAIVVAIGAYTNLALLEERRPGILQHARLFLMGGHAFPPRPGFPSWGPKEDWNIQVDVRSAQSVLERANPTLIPLSVTVETALRRAHLPALQASDDLGRLIARQAIAFEQDEKLSERLGASCLKLPSDLINFLHDPLACAIALGWREGVEIRQVPLAAEVRDGWLYQRTAPGGRETSIVTRIDGAAFSDFWLRVVTGGEEPRLDGNHSP